MTIKTEPVQKHTWAMQMWIKFVIKIRLSEETGGLDAEQEKQARGMRPLGRRKTLATSGEESAGAGCQPPSPTPSCVYGKETEHHRFLRYQAMQYWPHGAGTIEIGTSGGLPYFAQNAWNGGCPRNLYAQWASAAAVATAAGAAAAAVAAAAAAAASRLEVPYQHL